MAQAHLDMGVDAMRETFYLAVHKHNFKNGAFNGLIKRDTPALHSIDIFLSSPHLTAEEKEGFKLLRATVVNLQQGKWKSVSDRGCLMDLSSLEVTSRVFEEDMRKQGLYVPPMLIQSLEDRTNEVTGTYTCDSSGNTQEMPGGILGAIPGAPEAFNAANVAQMKSLGLDRKPKGRKRKQTTRTQGDSDKEENKKVAGAGFNVSAEQDVKANSNNTSEFGKAFERNLSGAFL